MNLKRCYVLLLGSVLWLAVLESGVPANESRPARPNVVIIFVDDLGYRDLGCYGGQKFATPHLDRLADEGMRFTDFHVPESESTSSRVALLTGCYPVRVGLTGAIGPRSRVGIHQDEVLLSDLVKVEGYATACFGNWHLGDHLQFLPHRHGFDHYFGIPYSNDMWPFHPQPDMAKRFPPLPLIDGSEVVEILLEQSQLTTWYTERAVRFIEENAENPFLLYVPHAMPHVPLYVSAKFQGKTAAGMFGDVIQELDWSVGQILSSITQFGLDDETLVIFASDNGPWLSYGNHAGSAGPLRGGKHTTFEGGHRVPCLMRWPGKIPAGKVCDELISTMDFLPTIAQVAGGSVPAERIIDGHDIWPILSGRENAASPWESFYYYKNRGLQALRSGRWKLTFPHQTDDVQSPGNDGQPGETKRVDVELSLFDLEHDIRESVNLIDEHPDVVKRLHALAEDAREDLGDRLTGRVGRNVRPPGRIADDVATGFPDTTVDTIVEQAPATTEGSTYVAYSSDGRLLGITKSDSVELFQCLDFSRIKTIRTPSEDVGTIVFGQDGRILALGGNEGSVSVWDPKQGRERNRWKASSRPVQAIAFNRDGSSIAWVTGDASVYVANLNEQREAKEYVLGGQVHDVAYRRDGTTLVVGGSHKSRGVIRLLRRGRVETIAETNSPIRAIEFTPDGNWFAAASDDGSIQVWDKVAKKKIVFHESSPVSSVSFGATSPNSDDFAFKQAVSADSSAPRVAWGTNDGTIRLWQSGQGDPVTLRAWQASPVRSLAFDMGAATIAIGSTPGFSLWGKLPEHSELERLHRVAVIQGEVRRDDLPLPREHRALFEHSVLSDSRLVVEVERVDVPPTIDGRFNDWNGIRQLSFTPGGRDLTSHPNYRLRDDGPTEPAGTSGNSADLSGQLAIRWDDEAFYLAAWVDDNVHDVEGTESSRWWEKDSVSLFLDVPNDGDGSEWIPGDHAFSFIADPLMPQDVVWWRHGNEEGHQEIPAPLAVRMAVVPTGDGYVLEACIPMSVLSALTPDWKPPFDERVVGFMAIITDPDGGPNPFGGELIFGGDNDDDGQWAALRLVNRSTSTTPRLELPIANDSGKRTTDSRIVQLVSKLQLPDGFQARLFANVPSGPTRMAFGPDGRLYVTAGGWGPGGAVWALEDSDHDGVANHRVVIIKGLDTPLGLVFRGKDLYVTHRTGKLGRVSLYRTNPHDGRMDFVVDVLTTSRNQGHGIGHVLPGPDDKLYVSQGSQGDLKVGDSPLDCTIWRMDPDGKNTEVICTGLRFAYGFAFDKDGNLFATDNSPNHLPVPHFDELNRIVAGRDYGFPSVFLKEFKPAAGLNLMEPVVRFAEHASACGMAFYTGSRFPAAYHGNAFVALWGPADPHHVDLVANPRPEWDSYYIARVELDGQTVKSVSRFAGDFRHPIDVITGPDGALYVADWGSTGVNGSQSIANGDGAIFRIDVASEN